MDLGIYPKDSHVWRVGNPRTVEASFWWENLRCCMHQSKVGDRLQREGERLKESVKEFGYAEASHVFILGTK